MHGVTSRLKQVVLNPQSEKLEAAIQAALMAEEVISQVAGVPRKVRRIRTLRQG